MDDKQKIIDLREQIGVISERANRYKRSFEEASESTDVYRQKVLDLTQDLEKANETITRLNQQVAA